MKNGMAWAALVALVVAGVPVAMGQEWDDDWGDAPVSANTSDRIQLKVCNRSNDDALVAVSYIPLDEKRFYNRGWFRVNAGQCHELVETRNSNFYFYADVVGKDRHWGGSHNLCVQYPGPYNFYSDGSGYCDEGQETRGFSPAKANEFGTFTWNLDP